MDRFLIDARDEAIDWARDILSSGDRVVILVWKVDIEHGPDCPRPAAIAALKAELSNE